MKWANELRAKFEGDLPGSIVHNEVMSYARQQAEEVRTNGSTYREGGVMMLIYPIEEVLHTALILRPTYEGVHSGQVAFPGGAREDEDGDLKCTALRETEEEVGVKASQIEVIGELSELYIPPSNFIVKPFVGVLPERPTFIPDDFEVAKIMEPSVDSFLKKDAVTTTTVNMGKQTSMRVKAFMVDGHVVWGATAMMLAEFRALYTRT